MFRILAAVALAALAAVVLVGAGASAQNPAGRTLTFTELEKGGTFKHIRNTKTKSTRANSAGDVIVSTNPVADASGQIIGKSHNSCVTTAGARNFLKSTVTCQGVLVLRDGTLTAQLAFKVGAASVSGPVTGGTGAYANARGVFVTKTDRRGQHDTITLAG